MGRKRDVERAKSAQLDLFIKEQVLGCIHGVELLKPCEGCDKFVAEAVERYERQIRKDSRTNHHPA